MESIMNYTWLIMARSAARNYSALQVIGELGCSSPLGGRGPRRAAPGGLKPALCRLGTGTARALRELSWNWREGSESATERGQAAVLVRDLGALLGAGVRVQHSLQVRAEWEGGDTGQKRVWGPGGQGGAEWRRVFCYCGLCFVRVISRPSQWHVLIPQFLHY